MKKWLNNYFGFTKREYNALLVLFGLFFLIIVTPYGYAWLRAESRPLTPAEAQVIQQLIFSAESSKPLRKDPGGRAGQSLKSPPPITMFYFNPNTLAKSGWQKLGLSEKQAQSIINYREKGGRFHKVTDLKRIYVISPSTYKQLAPYIQLPEQGEVRQQAGRPESAKKEPPMVNINRADTVELDLLKGVGPAFARRIVKYRDRLGGFYHKEQLLEVYGIDSLKYEWMKMQLLIDLSAIRKIPLNTVSAEELSRHPYLTYKLSNALIQYRRQHGNFRDMADLKKVLILDSKTIERLSPYLEF